MRRGGGGEMGFRVGPFVLCKNRCWRQRHRNTKFGPKKFFPPIIPPPHLSSQNDQRDVGINLSHRCWVDPPPRHGRSGAPALNPPLPSQWPRREGGGLGKWASVSSPPQSNFLPALLYKPPVLWAVHVGGSFCSLSHCRGQWAVMDPPGHCPTDVGMGRCRSFSTRPCNGRWAMKVLQYTAAVQRACEQCKSLQYKAPLQ